MRCWLMFLAKERERKVLYTNVIMLTNRWNKHCVFSNFLIFFKFVLALACKNRTVLIKLACYDIDWGRTRGEVGRRGTEF